MFPAHLHTLHPRFLFFNIPEESGFLLFLTLGKAYCLEYLPSDLLSYLPSPQKPCFQTVTSVLDVGDWCGKDGSL